MNEPYLPKSPDQLVECLRFLHEERKKFPRPPRRLTLTTQQRTDVLDKTDSRCHLCGGKITENKFAADHHTSEIRTGCANQRPSGSVRGNQQSSSRTGLLPSSPLRTVHESFPSHSSSPSNASFRETRFRDRNSLAMNPVMALWMK